MHVVSSNRNLIFDNSLLTNPLSKNKKATAKLEDIGERKSKDHFEYLKEESVNKMSWFSQQ